MVNRYKIMIKPTQWLEFLINDAKMYLQFDKQMSG